MITKEQLKQLTSNRQFPSISILIPTHRSGEEVKQEKDKILFKNQLKKIEQQLNDLAYKPPQIAQMLKPFRALTDDTEFWHNLSNGLAVFQSGDHFEVVHSPEPLATFAGIQETFYITPFIPVVQYNKPFYLLELNLNEVILYKADRYSISKMDVAAITPQRLEEVVGYDFREKSLQYHGYGARAGQTMYHGQGEGTDDEKLELQKFFNAVDNGIMEVLNGERAPLVLACVDYFYPIYKEVSNYKYIGEAFIKGSHKNDHAHELHRKAVNLLGNYFEEDKLARYDRFQALAGTGKTAQSVENILPEAQNGRVEHLMLQFPETFYGKMDRQNRTLTKLDPQAAGSNELLNETAIATFQNGGTVDLLPDEQFPVEDTYAIAVYRY